MKRRILCSLLCLSIVIGNMTLNASAAFADSKDVDWGLTLMVDDVTQTGMFLLMKQSGGNFRGQLEYCDCFSLEVLKADVWCPVPCINEVVCGLDPDNIRPDAVSRLTVSWEQTHGALPVGRYRYTKRFTEFVHEDPAIGDEAAFSVEFVIADGHKCHSDNKDHLCDICLAIIPHICEYQNGEGHCRICGKEKIVYRVTGSADWMGLWEPDNDLGIMTEVFPGVYRKVFQNVPAGSYELKVTQNGQWDGAYGYDGGNYCIRTHEDGNITVDFTIKDGIGIIDVYCDTIYWDEEENPGSDDLDIGILTATLLTSAAVLALLIKRENMRCEQPEYV